MNSLIFVQESLSFKSRFLASSCSWFWVCFLWDLSGDSSSGAEVFFIVDVFVTRDLYFESMSLWIWANLVSFQSPTQYSAYPDKQTNSKRGHHKDDKHKEVSDPLIRIEESFDRWEEPREGDVFSGVKVDLFSELIVRNSVDFFLFGGQSKPYLRHVSSKVEIVIKE